MELGEAVKIIMSDEGKGIKLPFWEHDYVGIFVGYFYIQRRGETYRDRYILNESDFRNTDWEIIDIKNFLNTDNLED